MAEAAVKVLGKLQQTKEVTARSTSDHQLKQYARRGARVAEEARLESVYTPKGYRGFESLSLRKSCKILAQPSIDF